MKTIDEYLDEQINEQLCQAVLSGSKGEGPSKAKIRPVEIKGQVIYQDVYKRQGFNIVQNNGEQAGQTVFHFHMHLIPRYKGDKVGIAWEPGTLTDEMKNEILEKMNC